MGEAGGEVKLMGVCGVAGLELVGSGGDGVRVRHPGELDRQDGDREVVLKV